MHVYKHETNIIFDNTYDSIKNIRTMFGYLSSLTFKKVLWDKYAIEKKFIGSAYPHVYILFSILKICEGETEWVSNKLIGCREDNDSFLLEGLVKRLSYYRWKVLNLTYKYYLSYSSFWFRIFPLLITPCSIMLIIRFFIGCLLKNLYL
ncbi:MAG: hypothetical protein LBD19_01660 [Endomicrobium sp.]|jgi:abequosyltransferase|nr:hypothetical protein [Endomicrobium sp.]